VKIYAISDLHVEFGPWIFSNTIKADVVILAGDIGVGMDGLKWAVQHIKDIPVIYVPGNHEYFHQNMETLREEMKHFASKHTNLHLLDDGVVKIDDVTFVGGTLWTDFELFHNRPMSMVYALQGMADYEVIMKDRSSYLVPADTLALHKNTLELITSTLHDNDGNKTVVVTHHCPSEMSVSPRYRMDNLTPAFASDLSNLIITREPSLWIHGHTHEHFDYTLGNTRVLCTPRGYAHVKYKTKPGRIVEV
jgi:Icc-related predicted phosphoesterase